MKDINGDGYPDLIFNQNSPTDIIWHENLQNNTFSDAPHVILDGEDYEDIIQVLDFDFDGDFDVAYMDGDDNFIWFENDGLGNFSDPILTVADGWQPGEWLFYDVDNDNDMDLLYHVSGYSHFIWHLQVAPGIFGEAEEWIGVSNVDAFTCVDVEGDGDIDIFTNRHDTPVFFENFVDNPKIKGRVFWDVNENGLRDSSEIGLDLQKIVVVPSAITTFSSPNGEFLFPIDPGEYALQCFQSPGWGFSTDSIYTLIAPEANDTLCFDFGLVIADSTIQIKGDLVSGPTRCSFEVPFWVNYENTSAIYLNGQIQLEFDSLLLIYDSTTMDSVVFFETVQPNPDSIVGKYAYWSFDSLPPAHSAQLSFSLKMPPADFLGDTILINGGILVRDELMDTLFTDEFDYLSEIRCAYDPNDKLVKPYFEGYDNYALFSDTIVYTIRFQNIGNDTAFNVRIEDFLQQKLDWSSLKIISASHPYNIHLNEEGKLSVLFNDILLPPQLESEVFSQRFIKFSILPEYSASNYSQVNNTASIFFDFNPPITTNTVNSVLVDRYPVEFQITDPVCYDSQDGTISITFPPNYFEFNWGNGLVGNSLDSLPEGSYFLEVRNEWGTIVATDNFYVDAPSPISVQFSIIPTTQDMQNGVVTTLPMGGTPPYIWLWDTSPPQTTSQITDLESGEYAVTISDANDCLFESSVIVEEIVSTWEINHNSTFEIQPNPMKESCWVNLEFSSIKPWELSLHNTVGKKVKTYHGSHKQSMIIIEDLTPGLYFVSLRIEGEIIVKKLIVE